MSKKVAGELTELMIGVVTGGTGTAAAIPEAQVAGKTGTAELGPKPGTEGEEEPEQIKDAWFTAFAPAEKAKLAVGVLLVEAEAAGGEVAAPIAAEVLSAQTDRGLGFDRHATQTSTASEELEVQRDLGRAFGAGDRERQGTVLGGRGGQLEEHQRALDRALLGGRVDERDLFLRGDRCRRRGRRRGFRWESP